MATIDTYDTKDGRRWRVIYRKPDGTQTSRRGFQRKRDAQEWLAEHVTVAKASGTFIDPQAGRRKVGGLWPAWIAKKRVSSKASYVEIDRTRVARPCRTAMGRAHARITDPRRNPGMGQRPSRKQERHRRTAQPRNPARHLRRRHRRQAHPVQPVRRHRDATQEAQGAHVPHRRTAVPARRRIRRPADDGARARPVRTEMGRDGRTARRGRGFRQTPAFGQTERHHSRTRGGGRPAKIRQVEAGRVPRSSTRQGPHDSNDHAALFVFFRIFTRVSRPAHGETRAI